MREAYKQKLRSCEDVILADAAELMSESGHSRQGRASGRSSHVRYAKSGSNFTALAAAVQASLFFRGYG